MSPDTKELLDRYRQAESLDARALERMSQGLQARLARGVSALPGIDASQPVLSPTWLDKLLGLTAGKAGMSLVTMLALLGIGATSYWVTRLAAPAPAVIDRAEAAEAATTAQPSAAQRSAAAQPMMPAAEPLRAAAVPRSAQQARQTSAGGASQGENGRQRTKRAVAGADARRLKNRRAEKSGSGLREREVSAIETRFIANSHAQGAAVTPASDAPRPSAARVDAPARASQVVAGERPVAVEQASAERRRSLQTTPEREPQQPARGASQPRRQSNELDAELSLLRKAYAQLHAGHAPEALGLLDEHVARFPHGQLRDSREVAMMLALCATGREAAARVRAQNFLAAQPESTYAGRVRGICPSSTGK